MFMSIENNSADVATCESLRMTERAPKNLGGKVMELDLGPIMFKLASKEDGAGWSVEKVLRVEGEYRKFLILCAEMPGEPIVPSKEVDEMWHAHILDTGKYATDCDNVFGYFLHHFPYLGLRGDKDASTLLAAAERTKTLHHNRFGSRAQTSDAADCMTGCGSVACSPSSCTNNVTNGSTDLVVRPGFEAADCMTGCGSVACSPSSCTSNIATNGGIDTKSRPTFQLALAA
jgi:hypothetical protein